jgi:hypothetical protein
MAVDLGLLVRSNSAHTQLGIGTVSGSSVPKVELMKFSTEFITDSIISNYKTLKGLQN